MNRMWRLLVAVAALTLVASTAATAAEESAPAEADVTGVCSLLTGEEVAAALGEPLPPSPLGPDACIFGDPNAPSTGVTVARIEGQDTAAMVAQAQAVGATEVRVGGAQAFQVPLETLDSGLFRSQVAVIVDPDTALFVSADAPEAIDVAAVVLGLAELAVGRVGPVTAAPSLAPVATLSPGATAAPPSAAPSGPAASTPPLTGLAGLFPTEIGGSPVTVETMSGRQFLSRMIGFRQMEQRVTRALRRRDMGIGDLTFAQGSPASQSSIVMAFQVDGGRIAPLVNVLLESLSLERTGDEPRPEDVAGKAGVFEILSGAEGLAYVSGDTLWIVFSGGPDQVEIFEHLP